MTVHVAGSARFQRRASTRRRRLLIVSVVLLMVGIAIVFRLATVKRVDSKSGSRNIQSQLSYSVKQAQDVNLVAGAVGQYAAAYNTLPLRLAVSNSSLVLCGTTCDSTAYEVGGFGVYLPSNIQLAQYVPGLVVTNQSVMYLVPGAKCGNSGRIGSVNTDPRSMVILFAGGKGLSVSPRCVVL